jgi:hypothetical protein
MTDGFGMMLPSVSEKSMMVRLPWVKGLLVPVPFDEFCKENGVSKIKDIYGKVWDIFDDDIKIIFTESQFKTHGYWDNEFKNYQDAFNKYKCEAAKLNEEPDNLLKYNHHSQVLFQPCH